MKLLALLLRRRPKPRPVPRVDAEYLHGIYRQTHRQVEKLRRAA